MKQPTRRTAKRKPVSAKSPSAKKARGRTPGPTALDRRKERSGESAGHERKSRDAVVRNEPAVSVQKAKGVQTLAVIEDEEGMRLDRWFRHRFPKLAMSHLNRIVRKGEVRVNGRRCEASTRLAQGDAVRVPPLRLDDPALPAVKRAVANEADLALLQSITLYEDEHLLVLNKPFGLAVQGGPGVKRHVDGMLEALTRGGQKPRLVHRIDRDTSGVLLVARTRKMAADLGEIFRTRQTQKIYWAVVRGVPKPAQGRISLYLKKGPGMTGERSARSSQRQASRGGAETFRGDPEKMHVARHGDDDAQHSVTYYTIVDKVAPRLAWLSMKPITGRTHQLRAHAEAIGHPIIGDPKYRLEIAENDPRISDPMRALPSGIEMKLHLLARRLVLPHPRGGTLDVTAPLPPHMQKTFDLFGFDARQYDPIEDAPE